MKQSHPVLLCVAAAILLCGCSREAVSEGQHADNANTVSVDCDSIERQVNPETYNLLAEQVVELWMYNHLNNFASYKKLLPKIKVVDVSESDKKYTYEYEVMYSATNKKGGTETNTMKFEVTLICPPDKDSYQNIEFTHTIRNLTPDSLLLSNGTLK